jgi:RND family efflux transporter MFP subunit
MGSRALRAFGAALAAWSVHCGVAFGQGQTPPRQTALPAAPPSQTPIAPYPGIVDPARSPARPEDSEIPVLVHAGEESTLSSQMAGKIARLHVGLGDAVQRGARLVEFDCSEQQAQLQAAEAEYRGARETHLSRLRLQALGAAGELEVTLAAAAAEKARSQVALRESQSAYCVVASPFAGKVARLRVKIAESVPAGQPLLDLVNPASLRAQLFVPAGWVTWLKTNSAFEVHFRETGRSYRARVTRLNARVEGVSQQLEIEARFEGSGAGLLPGMVGAAVFQNRSGR